MWAFFLSTLERERERERESEKILNLQEVDFDLFALVPPPFCSVCSDKLGERFDQKMTTDPIFYSILHDEVIKNTNESIFK